jgi:hypothetical protein
MKLRLSALNIFGSYRERRSHQEAEVAENSAHPKMIWKAWEHSGWGDSIGWMDYQKGEVHGHTTPLPRAGDELQEKMQSGKTLRFEFIKVRPCTDPSDMWFATVRPIDYL